ncbi:Protein indeterminate-domain 12 [Raphanus sativus]|uniref:Protein indeterminate-domain 12 n=1 Tax=Raphanus sativus TaxID=3726 RepID=A0A6J0MAD2_RAPSA|nr:protein indeterminate-domain 12 [Raphanus sativus]KAJ4910310.1 Protein indeterminate-domain 12 [Raphanus sativus]
MDMFSSRNWSYRPRSLSAEASVSSGNAVSAIQDFYGLDNVTSSGLCTHTETQKAKKRRGVPGNPDPDAEVVALSPKTLLATNRFVCEICNKGFQRDQNLQLHRRGHNLPWKLKQKNTKEQQKKKVYVCPDTNCVHHHPSRALGDLTGIKKHFCRKHGEKKWKCEKCSKFYAVQSDWKAHTKVCGTREYRCDCGTLFSRKDSFITHRAFCDALAEESARIISTPSSNFTNPSPSFQDRPFLLNKSPSSSLLFTSPPPYVNPAPQPTTAAALSATALLQKATALSSGPFGGGGQTRSVGHHRPLTTVNELLGADQVMMRPSSSSEYDQLVVDGLTSTWQKADRLTRDFLGLTGHGAHVSVRPGDMLEYAGGVSFPLSTYLTESHNDESSSSFQQAYDLGFSGPHNM